MHKYTHTYIHTYKHTYRQVSHIYIVYRGKLRGGVLEMLGREGYEGESINNLPK